jgi:tricorn protease
MRSSTSWTLLALAAAASADPLDSFFLANPDIHGDKAVFTRESDLWVADLKTGEAYRLTRHEGREGRARFSPDGSEIAFNGQFDGSTQIWRIPTAGGAAKKVTNHLRLAFLEDWSPDGQELLYSSYDAFFSWRPYVAPSRGGSGRELPIEFLGSGSFSPDGRQVVFNRWPEVSGGAWFRYQGGAQNDVWVGDLATRKFTKVVDEDYPASYPVWAGSRIYWVQENNASWTVMSARPDGGDKRRHAGPYDEQVFDLQTDGKKLIYVKGAGLEVFDLATNKAEEVKVTLRSERIHMRPQRVDAEAFASGATLTPTGKRLLASSRGQIVSIPAKEGVAQVWKSIPGARLEGAVMSPDAKLVAYISDETGEEQVWISDADGGNARQVTKDAGRQLDSVEWSPNNEWLLVKDSETRIRLVKADGSDDRELSRARNSLFSKGAAFSPDSKWVAFETERPWTFTAIKDAFLYEISSGRKIALGEGGAPAFSPDGKWLALLRDASFAPQYDNLFSQLSSGYATVVEVVALRASMASPFLPGNDLEGPAPSKEADAREGTVVDEAGIQNRRVVIPFPRSQYSQVAFAGTRLLAAGGGSIAFYDLGAKSGGTLTSGGGFSLSADGKSLLTGAGPRLRVVSPSGRDLPPSAGAVSWQGLKLDVDLVKEWEQIYWDAWRLNRDYFYVRNMHGADWDAIGKKYAKHLPAVRDREELTELIRWQQAELSIGHSFRRPNPIDPIRNTTTQGFLGIETEPSRGALRIKRIYRDDFALGASPLAEVGQAAKEGDYILAVNGQKVDETTDLASILADRVGRTVSLKVGDLPIMDGARDVVVQVISEAAHRQLWGQDVIRQRRAKAAEMSDGKIGYIFLRAMGDSDMAEFITQYFRQLDKEGLIIDIRGNNGGYIGGVLVNILRKETYMRRSQRNSVEASSRFHDSFEGHLSVIINEESYSDGEGFPNRFRLAGLGELVGKRTYGALVGSAPAWPFVDGGSMQVPRYGNYIGDEWVVEGPGVSPTIEVESDPNLYAQGVDAQLEAAVKDMLAKIARNPIVRPIEPPGRPLAGTRGGGR